VVLRFVGGSELLSMALFSYHQARNAIRSLLILHTCVPTCFACPCLGDDRAIGVFPLNILDICLKYIHLEENRLFEELGIRRTPVREALLSLAADLLVQFSPGKGLPCGPSRCRIPKLPLTPSSSQNWVWYIWLSGRTLHPFSGK